MSTDFAKAFDKLPQQRLLFKLKSFGILALLEWITDCLKNQKQRAVISNCKSTWVDVTSGVPQGSVLGPLLFFKYINDLPENMVHDVKIYADDSKILGVIKKDEDAFKLQQDIDHAVE